MLWPDRWPPTFGQRARLLERFAARAARRDDDGVAQLRQAEEVAAVQRQLHDLPVLDDVADLGGRRLQQRRRRLHDDLLGDALHAERELEVQRPPDLEDDAALGLRREPGQRRRDIPLPDAQRRKEEAAFAVGDALDHVPLAGCVAVTVAPGSTRAGAVVYDTADLTRVELR